MIFQKHSSVLASIILRKSLKVFLFQNLSTIVFEKIFIVFWFYLFWCGKTDASDLRPFPVAPFHRVVGVKLFDDQKSKNSHHGEYKSSNYIRKIHSLASFQSNGSSPRPICLVLSLESQSNFEKWRFALLPNSDFVTWRNFQQF